VDIRELQTAPRVEGNRMGVFIEWPPSAPVQSQCKTREWVELAAERVLIAMLDAA
jgi:hypothetical protein